MRTDPKKEQHVESIKHKIDSLTKINKIEKLAKDKSSRIIKLEMKESGVTIKSKEISSSSGDSLKIQPSKLDSLEKKMIKSLYTHNLLKLNQKDISNLNSSITNKSKTVIKLSPHEEKPCTRGTYW